MVAPHNRERAVEFLYLAIEEKDGEAVAAALRLGAPLDAMSPDGTPLLMEAASHGGVDCVRAFLDAGADVNMRDDCGSSVLVWASGDENIETVKLLIARGADVNTADTVAGSTALMNAAEYGEKGLLELLLKNGANVSLKDFKGNTAADIARENGNEDVVGPLLAAAERAAESAAVAARQQELRTKAVKLKPGAPPRGKINGPR